MHSKYVMAHRNDCKQCLWSDVKCTERVVVAGQIFNQRHVLSRVNNVIVDKAFANRVLVVAV